MRVQTESAVAHDLVDLLEISAVGTAESMLVDQGLCPPPTMHVISALLDAPYVGYVVSRPFTEGEDAARAVAGMGALPAVMRAQRLVLTWEHHQLCTALELPDQASRALVVVDAGLDGHEVRWHPFSMQLGPCSEPVAPRVAVPDWGRSRHEWDGWLPDPIVRLLATWRAGGDPGRLREVYEIMQRVGYTVRWVDGAH